MIYVNKHGKWVNEFMNMMCGIETLEQNFKDEYVHNIHLL